MKIYILSDDIDALDYLQQKIIWKKVETEKIYTVFRAKYMENFAKKNLKILKDRLQRPQDLR